MALMRRALLALAVICLPVPVMAEGTAPTPAAAIPAATPGDSTPADEPDVWIFSGVLDINHETYSGTLVSGKTDTRFELKLADGATCDGTRLNGDVGMVRLPDIACSDGRSMRALFVPQGGKMLKVFGHVGDARFVTSAHLLGTEPEPEKKQTMAPTVPQVSPPGTHTAPGP